MPNIPTRINEILQEIVKGANRIFGDRIKKIILYGSYARGDFNEYSDLDILILTNLSEDEIVERRIEVWDLASDVGLKNDILISILLKNENDFNYWINTLPFYMNVEKEGVVLNG